MMSIARICMVVALLFSFACWMGNWSENNALRRQAREMEAQLEKTRAEHELALEAAGEAMRARREINEYQRERMCEAERALGNHPAFCDQPVPDDIRMLWQRENGDAPAAGAAGGH